MFTALWMNAFLLAALLCPQDTGPARNSDSPDYAELRDQVGTTLNGLLGGCSYDLDYSNLALSSESAVSRILHVGSAVEPDTTEPIRAASLLALLQSDELDSANARDEVLLRTPVQSFHLAIGRDRQVQWCTSDPAFYSVLRTSDVELLYYAEASRLEIRKPTPRLRLFTPTKLVSPLPASGAQIDQFVATDWKVRRLDDECNRIVAMRPDSGRPWLRLDVGPPPARLPYSCTWFGDEDDSPAKFQTLIRWSTIDGLIIPAEIVRVTHSKQRVDIARYGIREWNHLVQEGEVRLPVEPPERIEDRTTEPIKRIPRVEDLPEEWRELLIVRASTTSPSEQPR